MSWNRAKVHYLNPLLVPAAAAAVVAVAGPLLVMHFWPQPVKQTPEIVGIITVGDPPCLEAPYGGAGGGGGGGGGTMLMMHSGSVTIYPPKYVSSRPPTLMEQLCDLVDQYFHVRREP